MSQENPYQTVYSNAARVFAQTVRDDGNPIDEVSSEDFDTGHSNAEVGRIESIKKIKTLVRQGSLNP